MTRPRRAGPVFFTMPAKPKRGRPFLPPEQRASVYIPVRFTRGQWAEIERAAVERGLPDDFERAPLLRALALEWAESEGKPPPPKL